MHGGMGGAMGVGIPLPQGGASGGYSERDVQAYVLAEQIARLHADEIGRDVDLAIRALLRRTRSKAGKKDA